MTIDYSSRDVTTFVTMMNLLRRRRGVPSALFRAYWRGAHMQVAARLPGIYQYWQHHLSYAGGRAWPVVPGIDAALPSRLRFDGDAEMTFRIEDDLARYLATIGPLMDDEQNLFEETISYRAYGPNARTCFDELEDPSPTGDSPGVRFLVYLKKTASVATDRFRDRIGLLADTLAASEHVSRLRLRLVEDYDNNRVALEAPKVSNHKSVEDQYQGSIEIAFRDAIGLRRLADSASWSTATADLADFVRAAHAFRIAHTYTVYNHGSITLAGLRTPAVAAQITRLGATNQFTPEVMALLTDRHVARTAGGETASRLGRATGPAEK
jgi:hypothetical protein